jgi:hypothetical protein
MGKSTVVKLEAELLLPAQRAAVQAAAEDLYERMLSREPGPTGQPLVNDIWPNVSRTGDTALVVEPLDRLGGEPGKSGNLVLAGQFFATPTQIPSCPMIIKVSPEPVALGADERCQKLVDEWKAAKHLAARFADRARFACPLAIWPDPDKRKGSSAQPVVLWAPFKSPEREAKLTPHGQRRLSIEVVEMLKYLSAGSSRFHGNRSRREERLRGMIQALRGLVHAHCCKSGDYRSAVSLVTHYNWELRGFRQRQSALWVRPWRALWGNTKKTVDLGEQWPNPFRVLDDLSRLTHLSIRVGIIHGDVHPRNIVEGDQMAPCIIDFGWARPRAERGALQHIVKDFVLLEANLRFMTLPPFLPHDSVMAFANWIGMDEDPPHVKDPECMMRMALVQELRKVTRDHVGDCTDWDIEYVAPLFLMSLGLLRYCYAADCPWAARYTVLSLARYLRRTVLRK